MYHGILPEYNCINNLKVLVEKIQQVDGLLEVKNIISDMYSNKCLIKYLELDKKIVK